MSQLSAQRDEQSSKISDLISESESRFAQLQDMRLLKEQAEEALRNAQFAAQQANNRAGKK